MAGMWMLAGLATTPVEAGRGTAAQWPRGIGMMLGLADGTAAGLGGVIGPGHARRPGAQRQHAHGRQPGG